MILKIEACTSSLSDFPGDRVIGASPTPGDNFCILLNDGYPEFSGEQALMRRCTADAPDIHAYPSDGLKVAWLAADLDTSFSIVYLDQVAIRRPKPQA